jgi:nicotinate-nucleotide pyrophosphorylase (carboxylating)
MKQKYYHQMIQLHRIADFLAEDGADATVNAIPEIKLKTCDFFFISKEKEDFIVCGVGFLEQTLREIGSKNFKITALKKDGDVVKKSEIILKGTANAADFLLIERTALNLMQQLSGVSTKTFKMQKALEGTKIKILDTRKTTPGIRELQKYAVRVGGGKNHRFGLFDMIMIKDNHIAAVGGIKNAILSVIKHNNGLKIEVECETLAQVTEAIKHKIDVIMLDNMPIKQIKIASKIIRTTEIKIEVSGGVNFKNINKYKELDIDYISTGSLTHSVQAVDISAKINYEK